jgi:hypothetical protein
MPHIQLILTSSYYHKRIWKLKKNEDASKKAKIEGKN